MSKAPDTDTSLDEPRTIQAGFLDSDILNGGNAAYLAALAERWADDPTSVDPATAAFLADLFENAPLPAPLPEPEKFSPAPSAPLKEEAPENALLGTRGTARGKEALSDEALRDSWRQRGHLRAALDPLGLQKRPALSDLSPPHADPALLTRLERAYGGATGAEFMHLQDPAQRQWWIDRFENGVPVASVLSPERILSLLTQAEGFEHFCQQRFTGMRRFGLEGGESLIVALQALIDAAARDGARSISLGMPHRGRLNVMATILRKPAEAIFAEFAGKAFQPPGFEVSGDVKYHLGTATTLSENGHQLRLALLPNPSHLEAVDPVVLGRVRADQDRQKDANRTKHLGVLVHGDAAFAGQGVVYETLQLSRLPGYRTGGTVHFIVNNQIGFTTSPDCAHSGVWNTDVARTVQAPILHVNGDDPEAVARAAYLAHEWRRDFGSDVVVDILCYRRHGHNETDDPAFTQPAMVRAIHAHPTTRQLYARKLEAENVLSSGDAGALWDETQAKLQADFSAADSYQPDGTDWLDASPLDPTRLQDAPERIQPMTGVPLARLHEIGDAMTRTPEDLTLHPRLARQIEARRAAVAAGGPLDWATAESLALGSLALDGHRVRLSGQDSGRGTFSQRHAVFTDYESSPQDPSPEERPGERQETQDAPAARQFTPLAHLAPRQAPVDIWNSPLSEYGVLGFEYGYSLGNPEALVMWEAQFGDFANGAQIIIDQFLAAGETKWLRTSGLTLLLPHGYEGAGPEHSSARPERFLQLCAENNLRVCMPSTPASFFHLLRRQIARRCRKPLVVFSPKSLLRNRNATSSLEELGPHTRFQPVLPDPAFTLSNFTEKTGRKAERVVLCSGKVYYDLLAEREKRGLDDVALIRLEQLYPFPHHALVEALKRHADAKHVVWCQEEPRNAGAWRFVDRRLEHAMKVAGLAPGLRALYAGRAAAASPATGLASRHQAEQAALVDKALTRDGGRSPSFQP